MCRQMAESHLSGATVVRGTGRDSAGESASRSTTCCSHWGLPAGPGEDVAAAPGADLQGRPAATDLVAAVAHFPARGTDAGHRGAPELPGAGGAANVLDSVGREFGARPRTTAQAQCPAWPRSAEPTRRGWPLPSAPARSTRTDPALLAAVRAAVTDRLAVANPRYLLNPASQGSYAHQRAEFGSAARSCSPPPPTPLRTRRPLGGRSSMTAGPTSRSPSTTGRLEPRHRPNCPTWRH